MSYQYNLGLVFQNIAEKVPFKIALRYPDGQSYNFRWLDEMSNQQLKFLKSKGVKQGQVVAIFNEKSVYAFTLMIACLKAGFIYTNLDVSSPWQRIEKIVNNCQPKVVFFDEHSPPIQLQFEQNLSQIPIYNLANKDLQSHFFSYDKEKWMGMNDIHGGSPAYIMFTSGSTGFPKGALMSHNNLLNFIQWGKETFEITEDDVFTNANPIYFDNSVFDFYTSIFNGCTLVPLSHELVKNPGNLVKAINTSGCSIWFSVPSLLVYLLTTKSLTRDDFKSIKRISFGGEGFPKNKLKQLYEMFGHRMTLFNVYGPTECTCICSSYKISSGDFENMNELAPLGNIANNFGYEILSLDNNKGLGELALIGPCVGMGYYNDPERTTLSFIQNPKSRFNQVMYKTGDIVFRAPNGYLHFKGRVDNQIKHMGYRIELEEVEAALSTLSYINESGVVYEKINSDLGQIKAFISVTDKTVDKTRVLSDIKALLPPYMIPRIIKILDLLPKNANGKIDRKQLASL